MSALREENITPVNGRAMLAKIAAQILELLEQRSRLNAQINDKYREAYDLGAQKNGFRLAIAHSLLTEEKFKNIEQGYKIGAEALGMQMDLFGGENLIIPPVL